MRSFCQPYSTQGPEAAEVLQAPHSEVVDLLKHLGFEKGWGKTVGRIREMMSLLLDILQAPDPDILEEFLGRLPTINKVVILSPHGFFGQKDVLGKPDTGGQVMQFLGPACRLALNLTSCKAFRTWL